LDASLDVEERRLGKVLNLLGREAGCMRPIKKMKYTYKRERVTNRRTFQI